MTTGDVTTLDSVWGAAAGGPITDAMLEWPPDVFALTEVILDHAEAYRFVVSPPVGRALAATAHPRLGGRRRGCRRSVDRRGPGRQATPDLVAQAWAIVRDAAATPIDVLAEGRDWSLCEALLTLHAVADEACAGMGVSVEGTPATGCALRGRARELLARTGSLARVGRPGVRVLPKVLTPAGGISLRSLARYACVRGPGVAAVWHKVPAQRPGLDPRRQPANILLLPWPLRVRDSDFRPVEASAKRAEREPFGFFEFDPAERFDLDVLDRVLTAALDDVDVVDMVVLPESAVPEDMVADVEAVLARHRVGALVAGVQDTGHSAGDLPGNWVHLGVALGGCWWHYRQNKHHRWSLDESQILQYHLGATLDPTLRWWESMEVPRRSIQFLELGGGITFVAVVCEDLARLDAVAELLRTVGPTLVVTVLLDGPQLASRWTARYASVLADDPGSAVLTLTSFGMVERSRPGGLRPSRVVALWKDPTRGIREIPLDDGAHGVLLSACVDRAPRHSADGRWPTDDTTHLRVVGVHQVRAASAPAAAREVTPETGGAIGLDVVDLSVLSSWAEALAEAGSADEVDAVLADAAAGATWRARFGLEQPSDRLGSALGMLARVTRPAGERAVDRRPARACGPPGHAFDCRGTRPRSRDHSPLISGSWRTWRRSTTLLPRSKRSAACSATRSSTPPSNRSVPSGRSWSSRAVAEQRKLVTVLFSDLVDFTVLSQKLDAEDVRTVIDAYFVRWNEHIEANGGVVEKFIGDAVMAVFGLHQADEKDPHRAIRAALSMRSSLDELNAEVGSAFDVTLEMRVGIDTGEVVTSTLGDRPGQEFVVVGEIVNRASRLQSAAPRGGVLVSADTFRHVRGSFDAQHQTGLQLKGIAEPVDAYLIQCERPRGFHVDGGRGVVGVDTRTVGRELEAPPAAGSLVRSRRGAAVADGDGRRRRRRRQVPSPLRLRPVARRHPGGGVVVRRTRRPLRPEPPVRPAPRRLRQPLRHPRQRRARLRSGASGSAGSSRHSAMSLTSSPRPMSSVPGSGSRSARVAAWRGSAMTRRASAGGPRRISASTSGGWPTRTRWCSCWRICTGPMRQRSP